MSSLCLYVSSNAGEVDTLIWDCGDASLFDPTHDDGRRGGFDAVYVHDKRRTGEEKGEQKQAPFLLWRFLAFFGE
jgi:hypothetical protein